MKKWQYIQLIGTTATTFLSILCIGMLVGSLIFGIYLIHSGALQWYLVVSTYLLMLFASVKIDRLFYRYYLLQRLRRMKKNKQEEDEKVNTSSGKRDIFVLILIFVGVPLYYYFSSSVHPEVTEDKIHESINWLTYLPFLIAIVCIGIFFLLRYLGKSSTTAGTESQNSVTNFRFSKQAAKNVGTVLGLLVAGFGIWLLWYYFKDTKKEEVQVVQPIPTSPRTVTYNWLDQNEPFEKKFTVHFDKKEVKQYKYMGQRYSYWPNVGETAHITVMNTSGKVLLDEVVKTVSIGNCKRDVRVCENVKEYGDTYIVSCDIADLNVYKQKE